MCAHLSTHLLPRADGDQKTTLAESSPPRQGDSERAVCKTFPCQRHKVKLNLPTLRLSIINHRYDCTSMYNISVSFHNSKDLRKTQPNAKKPNNQHICFPIFPIRFPGYTRNIKIHSENERSKYLCSCKMYLYHFSQKTTVRSPQ